jgi:hypothetical protein
MEIISYLCERLLKNIKVMNETDKEIIGYLILEFIICCGIGLFFIILM